MAGIGSHMQLRAEVVVGCHPRICLVVNKLIETMTTPELEAVAIPAFHVGIDHSKQSSIRGSQTLVCHDLCMTEVP